MREHGDWISWRRGGRLDIKVSAKQMIIERIRGRNNGLCILGRGLEPWKV